MDTARQLGVFTMVMARHRGLVALSDDRSTHDCEFLLPLALPPDLPPVILAVSDLYERAGDFVGL